MAKWVNLENGKNAKICSFGNEIFNNNLLLWNYTIRTISSSVKRYGSPLVPKQDIENGMYFSSGKMYILTGEMYISSTSHQLKYNLFT